MSSTEPATAADTEHPEAGAEGEAAHLAPLAPGWALWRDLAVRSAGFPVDGLEVFGPGDEAGRLRAVARDERFREAVTWQNRAARRVAIDKLAVDRPTSGSKRRQREELVASYWQRYCAKNDTIGFFGPLAWGRVVDDGPALTVRAGRVDAVRSVHFEAWGLQAVADALGLDLQVPLGPHPERDVRLHLDGLADAAARERGLAVLDRLERHREAIADAPGGCLDVALEALDDWFRAFTEQEATRNGGAMYASRTLVYLDCMRDLDVAVGPGLRAELGRSLPALLDGGRWYCGQLWAMTQELIADAVAAAGGRGPAAPVVGPLIAELLAGPAPVAEVADELRRRWASLLAEGDPATLAARARVAFAGPAGWPLSVYHCPDVQVGARSLDAVEAGDFLCVVGDHHPGTNVLGQGLFSQRHPDRARFLADIRTDAGEFAWLVPLRSAPRMSARIMTAITRPTDLHVSPPDGSAMPAGHRTVALADLVLDGPTLVDESGSIRVRIDDLLQLPTFVAGILAYDPFPVVDHGERITVSRTVLRRETWNVPAGEAPTRPEDVSGWARTLGMPRRLFTKSPLEDKPLYLDVDSPVLARILCRQARRLQAERPEGLLRFTEMLPAPDECWLEDGDGQRYTSELRIVGVDLTHRAMA